MRCGFVLAVVLAVGASGCGGHTVDAIDADGGADGHTSHAIDADGGAAGTLPDAGPGCPVPGLFPNPDSSFIDVSLFDLPLDKVCGLINGYPGAGIESQACAGTIEVEFSDGPDTNSWWLFDAKTGELEAIGGAPGDHQCEGARPGFVYPSQCENSALDAGGWWSNPPGTPLCTGYDAAPSLQCGPATIRGPGTEPCINAGGVCVEAPDPGCCDDVPGFGGGNSGCPVGAIAIRCCALDGGTAGTADTGTE
jgi:hypothetical protein